MNNPPTLPTITRHSLNSGKFCFLINGKILNAGSTRKYSHASAYLVTGRNHYLGTGGEHDAAALAKGWTRSTEAPQNGYQKWSETFPAPILQAYLHSSLVLAAKGNSTINQYPCEHTTRIPGAVVITEGAHLAGREVAALDRHAG